MNNGKTFRLFISSTFSDFMQERQVLQEKVFPKIDKYLKENHPEYTFQPIDLRWGVSEEAQLDQKTLEVCLNEVKACKHYLHPNFLIMSGDRYGWVPLPYAIESHEFNFLYNYLYQSSEEKLQNVAKYLKYWYKEDINHLNEFSETHFVLQMRKDERNNTNIADKLFKQDFKTLNSENEDYNIYWADHEKIMRDGLQKAVKKLIKKNILSEDTEIKYIISATEAEVEEGIFQYLEPTSAQKEMEKENKQLPILDKEHIFGFIRDIEKSSCKGDKFIVNDDDYKKAQAFKENIKKELINLLSISTSQEDNELLDYNYIDEFTEKITSFLKQQIEGSNRTTEEATFH